MKKLTIEDIASLAGVSRSAVSKAINNYSDITPETREKILRVIKEHNYYPLESARILGKGKNDTIAFVSQRITVPFNALVLREIENSARNANKYVYNITPFSSYHDNKKGDDLLRKLLYGRRASVIVALAMNPPQEIILKYKQAGISVILVENRMKNAHSVNIDNYQGGFLAGEYLAKSGRKKIGIICGGMDAKTRYNYSYAGAERKRGFEDALQKYGIKTGQKYLEQAYNYTIREGIGIFDNFLHKGARLDSVFCASGDLTAMGIIESARKRGMKIPQDLAVIGYDDNYYSAFLNPSLTTIRQPIDKLGAEAFNIICDSLEGKPGSFKHIEIEPEFKKRQSA